MLERGKKKKQLETISIKRKPQLFGKPWVLYFN